MGHAKKIFKRPLKSKTKNTNPCPLRAHCITDYWLPFIHYHLFSLSKKSNTFLFLLHTFCLLVKHFNWESFSALNLNLLKQFSLLYIINFFHNGTSELVSLWQHWPNLFFNNAIVNKYKLLQFTTDLRIGYVPEHIIINVF